MVISRAVQSFSSPLPYSIYSFYLCIKFCEVTIINEIQCELCGRKIIVTNKNLKHIYPQLTASSDHENVGDMKS